MVEVVVMFKGKTVVVFKGNSVVVFKGKAFLMMNSLPTFCVAFLPAKIILYTGYFDRGLLLNSCLIRGGKATTRAKQYTIFILNILE